MDTAALDLSGLTEHGDILELDDSRRLRLLIEPDDIAPMEHINGCDAYGKVAWVERLQSPRPEGFDGSACKLWTATGDQFWWQPYRDGKDIADTPEQRQLIRDLMTWGFSYVAVVLEKRCDFGHWHEVEHHGCGGCDSVYPELISDLVGEVLG